MKRLFNAALVMLLLLPVSGLAQDASAVEKVSTVSTAEELAAALSDDSVTSVVWDSEAGAEVYPDAALVVSKPLIVLGSLVFVECTVRLESQIIIKGELIFGGAAFLNHGYVRIGGGGLLGSYQSDFVNYGAAYIEANGLLACDRGGGWVNYGVLVNEGTIRVTSDGGNASLQAGSVLDNLGALDVTSEYFYNYGATLLGDTQAVISAVSPAE